MYSSLLLSTGGGIWGDRSHLPQIENPSVMIGIGGSGLDTLRQVKKSVYRSFKPDRTERGVPVYDRVTFLGIDTDTGELRRDDSDNPAGLTS